MIAAGTTIIERLVAVEYLRVPVDETRWALAAADAERAGQRVPGMYSQETLRAKAEAGDVAVYEISNGDSRLGSMALEVATFQGSRMVNVVWMTVEAGRFDRTVRDAILETWRKVADALDVRSFMIVGRPGWEHVLEAAGLKPKELSRFWVFKTERIG